MLQLRVRERANTKTLLEDEHPALDLPNPSPKASDHNEKRLKEALGMQTLHDPLRKLLPMGIHAFSV